MIEHVDMLVAIKDDELRVNDRVHYATVANYDCLYIDLSEKSNYLSSCYVCTAEQRSLSADPTCSVPRCHYGVLATNLTKPCDPEAYYAENSFPGSKVIDPI